MTTHFHDRHSAPAAPPTPGTVPAAPPYNEAERLRLLADYQTLDAGTEQAFDDLATLAAAVCHAPMAFITLVDQHRQVFKARQGLQADDMPRDMSFCAHAILTPDTLMEVPDATQDGRFTTNPLVTGPPGIRFYAGAPLVTPSGVALGTICIVDHQPRRLTLDERRALKSLARQAVAQMELRQAVADLEMQGHTDGLTGIGNRRAFDRSLRELWRRHAADQAPLSLLMADLDHFKRINDEFGHPAGDAVLMQTARLLRDCVRHSDIVARFGGEEFAVLLPGADLHAAMQVAEKVRTALQASSWAHRTVTASIGVSAATPQSEDDPATLLARADRALYEAKQNGRNQACAFSGWA